MSEEAARKKGLGRGLSALIQDEGEDMVAIDRMRDARDVPIELISPNPYQPRLHFDDAGLADPFNHLVAAEGAQFFRHYA